jgi:phosphopantetheinyl transferase (holo-ACP synthase)
MVGNDVVDLEDEETAPYATHPRFDERVFAPEELRFLASSGASDRLRWILWAAKESAFKVARKLDPRAIFSPRRLIVRLGTDGRGAVRVGERAFSLFVACDGEACHAVASSGRAAVTSAIRRLAPWESARLRVRRLAIAIVARELGARPADVTIVKEHGIPKVRVRDRPAPLDVSLSHHGRFVAFAWTRSTR